MSVVVTGLGAFCALGENSDALWAAVEGGASGIGPIDRFDVRDFGVRIGAIVRSSARYDSEEARLLAYARSAGLEALNQAAVTDRSRVAMVVGTCNGLFGSEIHSVTSDVADSLGVGGPSLTLSTACASSTHALGFAAGLVRRGSADFVLAGGVDTLCLDVFAGFQSLGLLSPTPCAPFSTQIGTTLGEGAAFMILETDRSARERGVQPLAELVGYGFSADAFHDTGPDPSGIGMARAIASALEDAGLKPEDIDYFNAHGTATEANDASEWRAIQRVFGKHADRLPVSSSKSFLGHAQGAAGVLEAVVTLLAMSRDKVPHTTNFVAPRPGSPADPVAGRAPRFHPVRHAVCANAAFGGANAALVFGRVNGRDARQRSEAPRKVAVKSLGTARDGDQVARFVPRNELRGMDASARLLSGAVGAALAEARIRPRTPACEGIGLFVAQTKISPDSVDAFDQSVRERGLANLSAPAFTRMVVNYATGVACRLFGLKGPSATLSTPVGSGLAALVLSLDHLAWRRDVDLLLAAATSDTPDASAILLQAEAEDASVVISGWGLAGDSNRAIQQALTMAGRKREDVENVEDSLGSASLLAILDAAEILRKGSTRPILVSSCASAVLLEAAHAA